MAHTPRPTPQTPPSPVDIAVEFPFLQGREKETVRLHPYACKNLPPEISKLGGEFIWPLDEPLPPRCPDKSVSAMPVLQLRREDLPEMPFPKGRDLFQMLWYPESYSEHGHMPRPLGYWRSEAELENWTIFDGREDLQGEESWERKDSGFDINPCALRFERVVEFPYILTLADEERERIEAWQEARGNPDYQYLSSTCPGVKVGGYPNYAGQDDRSPPELEYLLTISDCEWDGGSGPRWKAPGAEQSAIGTYLKYAMNVFVDRRTTPWSLVVAR